jgi:superfamily II DNA or RNA helicase
LSGLFRQLRHRSGAAQRANTIERHGILFQDWPIETNPFQLELGSAIPPASTKAAANGPLRLRITLDPVQFQIRMEWLTAVDAVLVRVTVRRSPREVVWLEAQWETEDLHKRSTEISPAHHATVRAKLKQLRESWPVAEENITACVAMPGASPGMVDFAPAEFPKDLSPWQWLARAVVQLLEEDRNRLTANALSVASAKDSGGLVEPRHSKQRRDGVAKRQARNFLHARLNYRDKCIELSWSNSDDPKFLVEEFVRCTGRNHLSWTRRSGDGDKSVQTRGDADAIAARLDSLYEEFPVNNEDVIPLLLFPGNVGSREQFAEAYAPKHGETPWDWLTREIEIMARECSVVFTSDNMPPGFYELPTRDPIEHAMRRVEKVERQEREQAERLRQRQIEILRERERREQARLKREQERAARQSAASSVPVAAPASGKPHAPLPPISTAVVPPELALQETMLPLTDLRIFFLRERAAQWWVSNQTDNLLCLPFCRIEQLEYQLRTALRVLGPLRGRALLSDEVGLGKTIEAGMILKELLTRGMAKRFLVLTVPSLVDQWQEELAEKFNLETATTNEAPFRSHAEKFWRESRGIVASLHTLKQPAHLAVAQTMNWDVLIVDEAHYLRNRTSQAWQAVNALPRQFLLLLTATPVQNSIEELYNLVTLLQPGQLPPPKEFRARFIDPERPHQPREADELRRLLGQVMIRNTRANAGINLPPRRAETVSFDPEEVEREFWSEWEKELRVALAALPANQSALWGRLLLQAAGSSPAAWREVLQSFPQRDTRVRWLERAPLEASWKKKCELLQPLTRGEGGVVIFTQFLQTQLAVAERLRTMKTPVFVINGQTPAEARHPITEEFRKHGGALILTHSGTEGRNLQFCHRLVNFDLPWNPMEIEQRIGRLHRLGAKASRAHLQFRASRHAPGTPAADPAGEIEPF